MAENDTTTKSKGRPVIDLTGQKFGKLTVTGRDNKGQRKNQSSRWLCVCKCGVIKSISSSALRGGQQSCGCIANETLIDLTGKQFGRLKVVEEAPRKNKYQRMWICECSCENRIRKIISQMLLMKGKSTSCGCFRKEIATKNATKHGLRYELEYYVWREMHSRCENPNNSSYKNYGARGISVCERWSKFENFIEDLGRRPEPESSKRKDTYTLERRDVNGSYNKENCYWATYREQALNKRNSLKNRNFTKSDSFVLDQTYLANK